jgi:3-hydroxyacyl-CoA dehydrogenase / enoyl-CoA hydratase / 3-hydroxybutyryl-CoA epimerase
VISKSEKIPLIKIKHVTTMNKQLSISNEDLTHWHYETDAENIIWLCIDKADGNANVLSGPVLTDLASVLDAIEHSPPSGVIVYSGKKNGFIMGADINEFTRIKDADEAFELVRLGQQVLDKLAALSCPTVAIINGFALGGGLELAMACDYRLAIENPRPILGLPEVQLGIHPGFGGTVRTVQISGVRPAMEIMLTGKSITVSKAKRVGLVDHTCASENWKAEAVSLLAAKPAMAKAPLTDRLMNLRVVRPLVANMLRKQVSRKAREDHYPAPYAIIDLWAKHGASAKTGYVAEAHSIAELMVGQTSRNLVRVFFLQNKLKAQGNKTAKKIERVHVVGAGVMGGDIAAWVALRGMAVTLQDRAEEYIQPAMDRATRLFDKKTYNDSDRKAAGDRLRADVAGDGVGDADLIIEAIFENTDAKQALYRDLQAKMKADAIIASNTSSIRLEELRAVLDQPKRFIGLHFFNPVAQLPLIELIRCDDTDDAVLDIAFAFIKAIGKYGLEAASAPGFVVNRVLAPYMGEAMFLAEEGVSLQAIDRAAENFGMPMGPVELVDTVGIDVALNVSKVLGEAFNRPVPGTLSDMVGEKMLGRKSGQGFYQWKDGKAIKPDGPGGPLPDDIEDRLILPMVNEAVAVLSEGVVADADLLDAGVIFGTGFAPFRGGPLQYARDRGIDEIEQKLHNYQECYGERYRPHAGWKDFR